MLTAIHPKIPMRNINITRKFYIEKLGFTERGKEVVGFDGYLILTKDQIELHFFEFRSLNPKENYGQIYIRYQIYNFRRLHTTVSYKKIELDNEETVIVEEEAELDNEIVFYIQKNKVTVVVSLEDLEKMEEEVELHQENKYAYYF